MKIVVLNVLKNFINIFSIKIIACPQVKETSLIDTQKANNNLNQPTTTSSHNLTLDPKSLRQTHLTLQTLKPEDRKMKDKDRLTLNTPQKPWS